VLPTREGREGHRFGGRETAKNDLFAALAGAILLRAIEPGSLGWCPIEKSMDAMHAGPVPYLFDKSFLAPVAEEIRESRGLCRLLVADDDRLIASSPDLVGPSGMPSDLASEI